MQSSTHHFLEVIGFFYIEDLLHHHKTKRKEKLTFKGIEITSYFSYIQRKSDGDTKIMTLTYYS